MALYSATKSKSPGGFIFGGLYSELTEQNFLGQKVLSFRVHKKKKSNLTEDIQKKNYFFSFKKTKNPVCHLLIDGKVKLQRKARKSGKQRAGLAKPSKS